MHAGALFDKKATYSPPEEWLVCVIALHNDILGSESRARALT